MAPAIGAFAFAVPMFVLSTKKEAFMSARHRIALAACLLVGACWLTGCGGGGGGDPAVDGNPPPATGQDLNPGLTGHFVLNQTNTRTYWRLDARTGTGDQVLDLAGANQYASATYSPDGSRYVVSWHDTETGVENSDFMTVQVYETASKALLGSFTFDGYALSFKFSRDNRYLGAVLYPNVVNANTLANAGLGIVDLQNPAQPVTTVNFVASGDQAVFDFDWLPQNRYVYLRANGKLTTGSAATANSEQASGSLAAPAGLSIGGTIAASPDGSQLLATFAWRDGAILKFDYWISRIDGSNLERFSKNEFGQSAAWSPDGKYIALRTNAGASFGGGGIGTAYCYRWYAPSTARNIDEHDAAARPVRYARNGQAQELDCFASVSYQQ
jgi:hypothetical protein